MVSPPVLWQCNTIEQECPVWAVSEEDTALIQIKSAGFIIPVQMSLFCHMIMGHQVRYGVQSDASEQL